MARKIVKVEKQLRKSKDGNEYILSTVELSDGTIATGYGDFNVGEIVQAWFDEQYNRIKIRRLK